jgi:YHS domain-containing protein
MVTDPVCKMEIDEKSEAYSFIFEGEKYFYCSEGSQVEFIRRPQDYVKEKGSSSNKPAEEKCDV